jgi:hypothetical protein
VDGIRETSVTIGGVGAEVDSSSSDQLIVDAPPIADANGPQTVTVQTIGGTATTTINYVEASVTQSTVEGQPTSVTANGTDLATVTLTLIDPNGVPITIDGWTVTFAVSGGPSSVNGYSLGNGSYTGAFASNVAGVKSVTAYIQGEEVTTNVGTVTFVAGSVSPGNSSIDANPNSISASTDG